MATSNVLSPEDIQYYQQQARAVNNTQAIGQEELGNAQAGADLTYQQKLAALAEQLGQQQSALPDKFAARGIQNSGIYNYGGTAAHYTGGDGSGWTTYRGAPGSQSGALQQFGKDAFTAQSDLRNQQENVDQGYTLKNADLNNTAANQNANITTTEAAQNASQAAADAINGA